MPSMIKNLKEKKKPLSYDKYKQCKKKKSQSENLRGKKKTVEKIHGPNTKESSRSMLLKTPHGYDRTIEREVYSLHSTGPGTEPYAVLAMM